MLRIYNIIVIIFLLTNVVQSQDSISLIIKTKPYQDIVFHNPDIGIEKSIGNRFSVGIEGTYLNRQWVFHNWDILFLPWDYGNFYNSNGVKFMVTGKYYFAKPSSVVTNIAPNSPFGWFTLLQASYTNVTIYNIDNYDSNDVYDESRRYAELYAGIGYQFCFYKRISFEIYSGIWFRQKYNPKQVILSGDNTGKEYARVKSSTLYPFISYTIGFYIR